MRPTFQETKAAGKPEQRVALRYRGGKARDAWWIIQNMPPHECYVEPYMGAASVLLQKEPVDFEVLNDLDGAVVNFFRVLREQPQDLMRAISLTPYSRREYQLCRVPCPESPLEWARRVYTVCWQSYSRNSGSPGGWRYQTSWANWNVHVVEQFAKPASCLLEMAQRLKHVQIDEGDGLTVIKRWDRPHTLFFIDPPYLFETRNKSNNKLYRCEMDDAGHRALAEVLHGIQGMAMVCGYPSPLYDELFTQHGWRLETKASYGEAQKATVEGLWINPAAQQAIAKAQAQGELALGVNP